MNHISTRFNPSISRKAGIAYAKILEWGLGGFDPTGTLVVVLNEDENISDGFVRVRYCYPGGESDVVWIELSKLEVLE